MAEHTPGSSVRATAKPGERSAVRRRALRWLWARRVTQGVVLVASLAFFVATARRLEGTTVSDPFFLVDPLLGTAGMLAARRVLPRLLWSLGLLGLTLVVGRGWCGWACPLGTMLDLTSPAAGRGTAPTWRRLKYLILVAILGASLLGSLTLVALDPLTILTRSLAVALLPALNWVITAAETALYDAVPFLREPLVTFETLVRGTLLPFQQPYFPAGILFGGLFVGILALNLAAPRFWCRTLCPLGAGLGLISRVAWLRRTVDSRCTACGRCARVCPTQTIDPEHGYASDPAECTMCLECLAACPVGAQRIAGSWGLAKGQAYDPSRRHLLLAAGAGLLGATLARVTGSSVHPRPALLRPPGAHDPEFSSLCVRCGRCLKACPTSGLQPSLGEAGLEGLWTPVLVPRLGSCNYSCNTCGQVCPTGAIPPLTLEEKRQQIIGTAYIDHNRCIPWADARECLVCEEVCPLPRKAIVLDEAEAVRGEGETVRLRRPRVVRERCIGCGLCENKCPLNSEAAIRVRVDDPSVRTQS